MNELSSEVPHVEQYPFPFIHTISWYGNSAIGVKEIMLRKSFNSTQTNCLKFFELNSFWIWPPIVDCVVYSFGFFIHQFTQVNWMRKKFNIFSCIFSSSKKKKKLFKLRSDPKMLFSHTYTPNWSDDTLYKKFSE